MADERPAEGMVRYRPLLDSRGGDIEVEEREERRLGQIGSLGNGYVRKNKEMG